MTQRTQQEPENVAVVNRYLEEVWNQGNLNVVDELFTEDYTRDNPAGLPPNSEGFKQMAGMIHAAFPDLTLTVDETLTQGDKVVQRWSGRGTHDGELFGVPPTGNEVSYAGISIYRLEDGKIARDWTIVDMMGIMQQIGAVPGPGE